MSDANRTALAYIKETSFNEAAPVFAIGVLTASGNPANLDTLTLNSRVYTFKTTLAVADDIKIGADRLETLQNICAAVNGWAGAGSRYVAGSPVKNADYYATLNNDKASITLRGLDADKVMVVTEASTVLSYADTFVGPAVLAGIFTSAPALFPFNSSSLIHAKETVATEEIRQDRSVADLIEVGVGANGQIETEFHMRNYDPFIRAALFSGNAVGATTAALANCTISTSGLFTTTTAMDANTRGARLVKIAGFTGANVAQNGIRQVRFLSTTTFQIIGHTGGSATSESTVTLTYAYARNGVTVESFAIAQYMSLVTADPDRVLTFHGMCVNQWSLTAEARRKIMQSFDFMGHSAKSWPNTPFDGLPTAATATPVITSSSNIGVIRIDLLDAVSPIQNFRMTINNNLRGRYVLSDKGTLVPGTGNADITGSIDAYFGDLTTYEMFQNHADKELLFYLFDSGGKAMAIHLPKIKFAEGSPRIPGVNTDIIQNLSFRAVKDDTAGYQVQLDFLDP